MTIRTAIKPLGGGAKIKIDTTPVRFDYTGSAQKYIVPDGCKKIFIDCVGASAANYGNSVPGKGGRVQCVLQVTPKQVLYIYVGQKGIQQHGVYSWNGGGIGGGYLGITNSYSAGGGATDIRTVPTANLNSWYDNSTFANDNSLKSRIVVAGGGGGSWSNGGLTVIGYDGGGLEGAGYSQSGGTQTRGGIPYSSPTHVTLNGQFAAGGMGAWNTSHSQTAGGGGGGWYGGAGQGINRISLNTYGGGGGSSYTHPTLCTNVVHTQGYNTGNGYIIITPMEK